MNSEELYNLLINFEEENLLQLGMTQEDESWHHPESNYRFEVDDNRLIVHIRETMISRLNASFDDPEGLYKTFIETGIIEPAVHLVYLREQGLDL